MALSSISTCLLILVALVLWSQETDTNTLDFLEWTVEQQYDESSSKIEGVIYPPPICEKPRYFPKPKKKIAMKDGKSKPSDGPRHWSIFFSHHYFPTEDFTKRNRNTSFFKEPNLFRNILLDFGVYLWIIYMLLIFIVSLFLIPLLGLIFFKLLSLLFLCIANSKTRSFCRFVVTYFHKTKRRKEFYLTPEGRKPPPNRFRIPKFIREDSDEDVPATLYEPPSSDFSEVNTDEEDISSTEEQLMSMAYGLPIVKRPRWAIHNAMNGGTRQPTTSKVPHAVSVESRHRKKMFTALMQRIPEKNAHKEEKLEIESEEESEIHYPPSSMEKKSESGAESIISSNVLSEISRPKSRSSKKPSTQRASILKGKPPPKRYSTVEGKPPPQRYSSVGGKPPPERYSSVGGKSLLQRHSTLDGRPPPKKVFHHTKNPFNTTKSGAEQDRRMSFRYSVSGKKVYFKKNKNEHDDAEKVPVLHKISFLN